MTRIPLPTPPRPAPRSRASPLFGLETLERNANRGGGVITTGAAADGLVVVGTTRGACVVHDLTAGAYREIDCLPLDDADRSRRELTVARIWLDPTARHAVAVLRDDDGRIVDTVYFHATFRRARPILGVRDASVVVTAVGWLADACEDDAAARGVGADDGSLFALHLDAIPRRPAPTARSAACWTARVAHPRIHPVIPTNRRLPRGARRRDVHGSRRDTPRLHAFVGAGSLEETLRGSGGRGPGGGGPEALVTMPEDAPRSELHVWRDAKGRRAPDRFACRAPAGCSPRPSRARGSLRVATPRIASWITTRWRRFPRLRGTAPSTAPPKTHSRVTRCPSRRRTITSSLCFRRRRRR